MLLHLHSAAWKKSVWKKICGIYVANWQYSWISLSLQSVSFMFCLDNHFLKFSTCYYFAFCQKMGRIGV